MLLRRGARLALLCLLFAVPSPAQSERDSPEPVIRALVTAIYANDVAAYERVTLPHPQRSRLTAGGRPNPDRLQRLRDDPGSLQIKQMRPFAFQGKETAIGSDGRYPAGTTVSYMVAHGGQPMLVGLVRRPEGWKVELRWWVAMMEMAAGVEPGRDSPQTAIRTLLAAALRLDRARAGGLLTDARGVDLLFAGAPSQRDPSGVLDATVEEMPLVEAGPGEFYEMPTGRIVEGGTAADRKVIVGWFGPIEMPFVVRRVGTDWRVEPEPYLAFMNQ